MLSEESKGSWGELGRGGFSREPEDPAALGRPPSPWDSNSPFQGLSSLLARRAGETPRGQAREAAQEGGVAGRAWRQGCPGLQGEPTQAVGSRAVHAREAGLIKWKKDVTPSTGRRKQT